ncbi:hypothetical protein VNI00_001338 [Paramarasmius palmivorus]|uniref:Uncharacterized protein n=1 Tax=Paramarasmius palmivorus TaxID=297713 RepID=A0AAW0E8W6_9AGAR
MRRLAAVFSSSSKRDKSDSLESPTASNPARRSRTNLSLSRKKNITASVNTRDLPSSFDSTLSTPQLSAGSDHGQSSASSTGSASLQTPEELPVTITSNAKGKGKSWIPFLGKRSSTIKRPDKISQEADWRPKAAVPQLRQPVPAKRPPITGTFESETEESEEEEEDEEDEDESQTLGQVPVNPGIRSREVLRAMALNSLQYQPSLPPFVDRPGFPLYPRSCNSSRVLQKRRTLETSIHHRRLLRRLRDDVPLTRQEERSILPFHTKRISPSIVAEEPSVNEAAPWKIKSDKVLRFSPGLRRWISRPAFEDRLCIWLPIDETLTYKRVSSEFAVAALEFSEAIEAMAYVPTPPSLTPLQNQKEPPASPPEASDASLETPSSSSSSASSHQSVSHSRSAPHLLVPSPLRNEANHSTSSTVPLVVKISESPRSSSFSSSQSPTSPTSPNATVKRGVRFAEDEKEDNIPIGYVMRIKKQKEQKARFLREEKERRQYEEEKRKVEEERRRREQERLEWEKERKAWEREKRAIEEERKTRLYHEEVIASRQRAENSRTGMKIATGSSSSLREERSVSDSRRYSRLPFDSALQTTRTQGSDSTSSPHTPSPGSSRPPSIVGNPAGNGAHHSRPSSFHSTHTASSEEMRHSMVSGPGSTASAPSVPNWARSYGYPSSNWTGSHSSLLIPPVPPVPPLPVMVPTDMPLLPPSAPFMMNSYPRPRSNQSPSRSSSRHRLSSNGSSDRVNQVPQHQLHPRSGSSSSGHRPNITSHSSSPSSSSHHRQTHHRRTSDDSITRRSQSSHTQIPSSYSQHSLPRGRSMQNVQQLPSPWTAMPTQMGVIPTAMPYYHHTPKAVPSRRQTTLT